MKYGQLLFSIFLFFPISVTADSHLLPDIRLADNTNQVVINIPNTRLFLYQYGNYANNYPATVGTRLHQTPQGYFPILAIFYHPTWTIPPTIQKERAEKGLPDITSIPPGPNNPLGPVFISIGSNIGIHGTNMPSSVPGIRSHGCIRMHSESALQISHILKKGDDVFIIYQRYALNVDDNGKLWFQKYENPYKQKDKDLLAILYTLKKWEAQNNAPINRKYLNDALKQSSSEAICLTCVDQQNVKVEGNLHSLAWLDGRTTPRYPYHVAPKINTKLEESLQQSEESSKSSVQSEL